MKTELLCLYCLEPMQDSLAHKIPYSNTQWTSLFFPSFYNNCVLIKQAVSIRDRAIVLEVEHYKFVGKKEI